MQVDPIATDPPRRLAGPGDRSSCRILTVDPFPVLQTGLDAILNAIDGAEHVGHAESLAEACLVARRTDPDVVMLETDGTCDDVLEELPLLLHENPATRVLVFSASREPASVRRALAAGATGYVHKTCRIDELERGLRAACAGQEYVDPRLGACLASTPEDTLLHDLSGRELEVLMLLALGYANKEVADRLHVSVRTVETHRSSLMAKLRITTRRELVATALRAGLLREDAEDPVARLRRARERSPSAPAWSSGSGAHQAPERSPR